MIKIHLINTDFLLLFKEIENTSVIVHRKVKKKHIIYKIEIKIVKCFD